MMTAMMSIFGDTVVAKMIRGLPRKLDSITLGLGLGLALLISATQCTDKLAIQNDDPFDSVMLVLPV